MIRLPALSLLLAAAPLLAQNPAAPPPLSLEQRMLLRCSAALAMAANRQAAGDPAFASLPPLATRGRAFFVVSAARVMDETGQDRAALAALLEDEARNLAVGGQLQQVLPVCLSLLPPE